MKTDSSERYVTRQELHDAREEIAATLASALELLGSIVDALVTDDRGSLQSSARRLKERALLVRQQGRDQAAA